MRILFVASGNHDSKPGIIVENQADSLINIGQEVSFFLIKGKGVSGYLRNVFPLLNFIKTGHFEIIHSHYSYSGIVTTLALLLAGRNRPPHTVSLMGSDTITKNIVKTFLISFFSLFWHITIVKSRVMQRKLWIRKAYILPNGVDLNLIKAIENESEDLSNQNIPYKNKHILFAADPDRQAKNFSLAKDASQLAKKKLKVVFNTSQKRIIQEILNAGILLLTSKWEGSPNIIKEAMACNCPIVATKVGDIEWLFGEEKGHFLTSFDASDVAEKISLAYDYRIQHGRTIGRDRLIKLKLDVNTIAHRLVELYKTTL